MHKLALGTVQFGLDYGISNQDGQVKVDDVYEILAEAKNNHIDVLDTAIAYGDSEKVLGQAGVQGFRVVSKLPSYTEAESRDLKGWVTKSIEGSLERLRISQLDGLLLHNPQQLKGKNGTCLAEVLNDLKDQGLINLVGASVYSTDDVDLAISKMSPGLMQMPFNLFDRRMLENGTLNLLQKMQVEIHTRSAFLQGLLLMGSRRPEKFAPWQALFNNYEEWLAEQRLSALEACVSYPVSVDAIDRVVVGVNSVTELQEIVSAINLRLPEPPAQFSTADEELINPSNWNSL